MIRVSREGYEPDEAWLELAALHAARPRARKLPKAESDDVAFVRRVQGELTQAGYAPGPADGMWGPRTEAAFLQHAEALVPTLLWEVFWQKCCYCEQRLGLVRGAELEHFRPVSAAMGLDGTVMKEGYWWLTTAWENLYLSCAECNRNKADRFPLVDEGERARSPDADLAEERPLLLDPCSDDPREDPEKYLLFDFNGIIAVDTADELWEDGWHVARYGEHLPAQVTIDVIGLNRRGLVEARAASADDLVARAEADPAPSGLSQDELVSWYQRLVDPEAEFVAMQRQLLRYIAEERFLRDLEMLSDEDVEREVEKKKQRERISIDQREYQAKMSATSVEEESVVDFTRSARIRRITIANFRSIEHLEFDLGAGSADRTGWKMLLGENGVGKSTVLHAVALVLMGKENFDRLVLDGDLDPTTLLRRGAEAGFVECTIGSDFAPRRMILGKAGVVEFSHPAQKGSRTILLGFGSARWLYRDGGFPPDSGGFIRVRNLFNPFVPLGDAVSWLLELDRGQFGRVEQPLLRLLRLDEGERLRRRHKARRVLIERPGVPESQWDRLTDLSDGYQTVLAMTGDIVELLSRKFPDTETAEGVVLIDEIGAHLHPRWKMRVVSRLREAFPRVQFIVTTHEPLCLRGLGAGEIMVMRRDEEQGGKVVAFDDLPSVDDMRIDQLLTSELFGLYTTLDPETETEMNRYYELLARPSLSDAERGELDRLRDTVGGKGVLGSTARDRLIYEVVDEYVAAAATLPAEHRLRLKEQTKRRVAELWEQVTPDTGGEP